MISICQSNSDNQRLYQASSSHLIAKKTMDNPTYTAEIELEKGWEKEFFLDEKNWIISWSIAPDDNVVNIKIFRNEDKIYEKWVFLKFSIWDEFSIVLSLETIHDSEEVFEIPK